jgi:hypothetical protein
MRLDNDQAASAARRDPDFSIAPPRATHNEAAMTRPLHAAIALACLAATPQLLPAQERAIHQRDLPPAVAVTAARISGSAKVRGYTEEQEAGQTFYEVALTVQGRARDVLLDSTGAVVEVEEEVPLDSLPAPVLAALRARAGSATIRSVERLTKHDALVAYEAHLSRKGRSSEIQVGPMGERLDHEE